MPNFRTLSKNEIAALTARRPRAEALAEYLGYLETLKPGDWGSIEIEPGESQRAVKRRTSTAAKSQGKQIRWRRSLSEQQLVFEVLTNA
jgi:hypothetical protein